MDELIRAAVTLFVVIDPIGIIPLFLTATRHQTPPERRRTARRATLISAGILLAFILGGQFLLEGMHVRLESLQIAGGLILFLVGLTMVFDFDFKGGESGTAQPQDVAVFPLAVPYIAGPGAILAVVMLTDKKHIEFADQVMISLVLLAVLALTYLLLLLSDWILRLVREQGIHIVSRVLGLILCSLAVETTLTGIQHFWASRER